VGDWNTFAGITFRDGSGFESTHSTIQREREK